MVKEGATHDANLGTDGECLRPLFCLFVCFVGKRRRKGTEQNILERWNSLLSWIERIIKIKIMVLCLKPYLDYVCWSY